MNRLEIAIIAVNIAILSSVYSPSVETRIEETASCNITQAELDKMSADLGTYEIQVDEFCEL